MPLDFPNSPTVGATYTGPSGVIWTWDGVKWVNGTGVATYAPIGSPAFTGDPTAPTPAYGDNDTSVATTAFVQAATAPMTHNVGRNLLHNPLFTVQQRGAGPFTGTAFTADRWTATVSGGDTASVSLLPAAVGGVLGMEDMTYVAAVTFTGSAAGGSSTLFSQRIESVRRLAGKTVTISWYAGAGPTPPKVYVGVNQHFGTGGSPSADTWGPISPVAVNTTQAWARYSATVTLPSIAGTTIGTDGNDYTAVSFYLSQPSSPIGVQSGVIYFWGVQLEVGSVATPLERPDPQQDLAKCQRFYCVGHFNFSGLGGGGTNASQSMSFPVPMRAAPTVAENTVNASGCTPSVVAGSGASIDIAALSTTGAFWHIAFFTASADL